MAMQGACDLHMTEQDLLGQLVMCLVMCLHAVIRLHDLCNPLDT